MNTTQHRLTTDFLNSVPLERVRGAWVLDHGCGDGYASRLFQDYGATIVHSYDLTTTHIVPTRIPNIPTNIFYNIIWSHHVIEHQHNPIKYLKELRERLGITGELWLGCPNTACIGTFSEGHYCNFTIGNLLLCLQEAMFDTNYMSWWITSGQIRIRIRKTETKSSLPRCVLSNLTVDKHFRLAHLPEKLRW